MHPDSLHSTLRTAVKALNMNDYWERPTPLSHEDRAYCIQLLGNLQHAVDRWRAAVIHAQPMPSAADTTMANLLAPPSQRLNFGRITETSVPSASLVRS